jgi:hypothetical protein
VVYRNLRGLQRSCISPLYIIRFVPHTFTGILAVKPELGPRQLFRDFLLSVISMFLIRQLAMYTIMLVAVTVMNCWDM